MNQMFKKASSVFTAIVCAASITFSGASLVLADGEIDEQTKTTIETTAEGLTNTIIPLTEDEIAAYMESGDAFTENAMTAWDSAREELGDLKKLDLLKLNIPMMNIQQLYLLNSKKKMLNSFMYSTKILLRLHCQ